MLRYIACLPHITLQGAAPNRDRFSFKLSSNGAISESKRDWIVFPRINCNNQGPARESDMVVGLRRLMGVV